MRCYRKEKYPEIVGRNRQNFRDASFWRVLAYNSRIVTGGRAGTPVHLNEQPAQSLARVYLCES